MILEDILSAQHTRLKAEINQMLNEGQIPKYQRNLKAYFQMIFEKNLIREFWTSKK